MNNFIEINNLKKKFHLLNENELLIFENLNFSITKNSITSIVGSSGCGKSTLLNILGLLDSNFEGQFLFEGKAANFMSNNQLSSIRNKKIGFIHQFFNLIPELSVLENVILPGLINKNKESVVIKEACDLLVTFGILDKKNIRPNKLSGGEQQRTALARSMAPSPELLMLDEPFSGVDVTTEEAIITLLRRLRDEGCIILVSTHNLGSVPEFCDRTVLINRTILAQGLTKEVFTPDNLKRAFGGVLRHFVLGGSALHNDDDTRQVTVITDDERPFVVYGDETKQYENPSND